MNKYKDEKGHFTTKDNDGGPCKHSINQHPYLKQNVRNVVGSALILNDGNYFTKNEYGDHQELFNLSETKRNEDVIQVRNLKGGRVAQITISRKPSEEQLESLQDWIDNTVNISENNSIVLELELFDDFKQFHIGFDDDIVDDVIKYIKMHTK